MRIDRLNRIEQYVFQHGSASLEDLAAHFNVSLNTVRRDVRQLLDRGALDKVYGGVAVKADAHSQEPLPMNVRANKNFAAKQEIGRLAAGLVQDNSSIFLDSGSTTPMLLPHLAQKSGITVITHSLSALYEASKYPNLNVIALGGQFYLSTASYVGISTLEALSHMRIDTIFIAATGVSLENGLTNTTYLEAEVKRNVVLRGQQVVLMADHSKFDHAAFITFCSLEQLSCVVTDRMPSQPYLDVLAANHIRLLCPDNPD